MKVVVTGGAGYIGRYVMRAAAEAGCEALWLDKMVGEGPGVTADMCDLDHLREALGFLQPDGIIHLAAHSSVAESVRDPGKYAENVGMCRTLAQAAGHLPIVLASSAAVYGEGAGYAIPEWTRPAPVSPYGWSKLASEAALPAAMVLRLFNVAGGEGDQADHILPRTVEAFAAGQATTIHGDGLAVRDFVHVEDVARACVAAVLARSVGHPPGVFNICTGDAQSVRDVVDAVRGYGRLGTRWGTARPGDVRHLVGDNQAARDAIGWSPEFDFDQIVASAMAPVLAKAAA